MREHLTEEHREKIRQAALRRRQSEETKRRISQSLKGNQNARKKSEG